MEALRLVRTTASTIAATVQRIVIENDPATVPQLLDSFRFENLKHVDSWLTHLQWYCLHAKPRSLTPA
jgi:hypothetical protein